MLYPAKVSYTLSLLLFLVAFCFTGCDSAENNANIEKPNILLILADDMGWSDLGCYGSEVNTPNLDKLAGEGIRFSQFHNTSKCFPSRACLVTGLYSQQVNASKTHSTPWENCVTLGEALKGSGYITLWSGKHHSVENPVDHGFDHYYGLLDGCCNFFNPGDQRPGEGKPARKKVRTWCDDHKVMKPFTPESKDFYTTDAFTDRAIEWLDSYKENKEPVFLYMAYTAPHDPLMAWPEDIAKYDGKYDVGYETIRKQRFAKQKKLGILPPNAELSEPTYANWEKLSAEKKKEEAMKMSVYSAMIDRMDQNIGKLLKKLEETGRLDNTLIIFVSDNGCSSEVVKNIKNNSGDIGTLTKWTSLGGDWANVSNTPYRLFKNYSYEGGINTPMIAWWPGKIKNDGSTSHFKGHFIDIMPTLLDAAKGKYPETYNGKRITPMEGESLLPALTGKAKNRTTPLFFEWRRGKAVIDGNWKIVLEGRKRSNTNDLKWELYNLDNDPTETNNMAEMHPEIVEKLNAKFFEWKNRVH
jgi:arylsulfatase